MADTPSQEKLVSQASRKDVGGHEKHQLHEMGCHNFQNHPHRWCRNTQWKNK